MAEKTRNNALMGLMVLLVGAALVTLLPGHTSRPNDLGYFSQCPFAPTSTLTLLFFAGVAWVLRRYFITRPPLK